MSDYYDGPVAYVGEDQEAPDGTPLLGGWYYTVVTDDDGNQHPGERLHLEDTADGAGSRYRLATDEDTRSWHDRKHRKFATVEIEDLSATERVTADEMAAIQKLLGGMRSDA